MPLMNSKLYNIAISIGIFMIILIIIDSETARFQERFSFQGGPKKKWSGKAGLDAKCICPRFAISIPIAQLF